MDWKSFGWVLAIFSGFGAKIAFEISEKVRKSEKIKPSYWIQSVCGVIVTFAVGYHLRGIVTREIKNTDVQAGVLALIGVVGFSAFKLVYRTATNMKLWDDLIKFFISRYTGKKENKEDDDGNY